MLAAAVAVSSTAAAQDTRGALTQGLLAVTVSVIPMTGDTVIRDATVIIRDGRIAAISPARTARVPAGHANH